jgi:hypothetical protein
MEPQDITADDLSDSATVTIDMDDSSILTFSDATYETIFYMDNIRFPQT